MGKGRRGQAAASPQSGHGTPRPQSWPPWAASTATGGAWAPQLQGPVCIPTGVPNAGAPIRLGRQLSPEDRAQGAREGCPGMPEPWPSPLHSPQRPSPEGEGVFVQLWGWWRGTGSGISKQLHPLLPLPGPTPTPQAAFQSQRGSCPRRNPLNRRRLGLQPRGGRRSRPSQPHTERSGSLVFGSHPGTPSRPSDLRREKGDRDGAACSRSRRGTGSGYLFLSAGDTGLWISVLVAAGPASDRADPVTPDWMRWGSSFMKQGNFLECILQKIKCPQSRESATEMSSDSGVTM